MRRKSLLSVMILLTSSLVLQAAEQLLYKDASQPVDNRVLDLLERMTLEEKVAVVTGGEETVAGVNVQDSTKLKRAAAKRLGIPVFKIEHGPYGFKGKFGLNEPEVVGTYFPVTIAQAGTWDPELIKQISAAMGAEMHAAGGHANAGPAMNIIRDPRTGRSFEYFTEDPYLNGRMAVAGTQGLQSQKVMANLKHYVCNNQEFGRGGLNVKVSERALREIYLPGFEAAIKEGGAWSVMSAYNKLNGIYCSEQPFILNEILRKEWGFKGFVLSDWSGTHSTAGSANAGQEYAIRAEYAKIAAKADFRLGWNYENEAWLKEAVALAKKSDAVILTVGLSGNMGETEAGDRKTLNLFPAQERLINAIAGANQNTTVALIAGSAVTMDAWLENVPAVLMAWYPGQEGGHALAELLFGDVSPSGHLPITFPKSMDQYPDDFYTREREITYSEGIFVGYRYFDEHGLDVLFPFGHGLSYTTFAYGEPRLDKAVAKAGETISVSLDVTNTGKRAGAEVVQLSVHDVECSVPRPPKELKAFKKVFLQPGETKTVTLELDKRSFAFFCEKQNDWTVKPGEFELQIGSSSRDVRQKASCLLK